MKTFNTTLRSIFLYQTSHLLLVQVRQRDDDYDDDHDDYLNDKSLNLLFAIFSNMNLARY